MAARKGVTCLVSVAGKGGGLDPENGRLTGKQTNLKKQKANQTEKQCELTVEMSL